MNYTIKIIPNEKQAPKGLLAHAEFHFENGPFAGLKLIGFDIWEARRDGQRNVTFPARQYSVNGERRSFSLLRPIDIEGLFASNRVRDLILEAYDSYGDLILEAHDEMQQKA